MLKSKSLLAIDFGAGALKIAEFEPTESGGLCLKNFGQHALGLPGSQDAAREGVVKKAIQAMLTEKGFGSKNINVCAPGFHVFSKFVKLPPVDAGKVTQIIQYEAQQNVPFPLEEVVWDYQILGTTASGELEVLLVAIKTDIVEGLFRTAETHGFVLNLVDVSPAAICNAFRYNYGDLEGCTMLLDIGAKTSNLLFLEKGKVFTRSINIGANSITQEFANEAKIRFPEAEKFKIEEGFVALGGAYEEPDNPRQAQVSKIARQVMTRLHIQVNQTMQFYRSQQAGSAPQRLFLAGGASIMPYTAEFFNEKLSIEIEYFNPFRTIEIDPAMNLEELAKVAHSFGEVVGLGLRSAVQCPVELNLMPKASLRRQELNQKKPFFIATIFCLVLVVAAFGWFYSQLAKEKQKSIAILEARAAPLLALERKLKPEEGKLSASMSKVEKFTEWLNERYYWSDLLTELRASLMEAELETTRILGTHTGVWIESFMPDVEGLDLTGAEYEPESSATVDLYAPEPGEGGQTMMMDIEMMKRYGLLPMGGEGDPFGMMGGMGMEEDTGPDELASINLRCRGVNRISVNPSANDRLAFSVLDKLHSRTNLFDVEGTKLTGEIPRVGQNERTFTFEISLKLKTAIQL